MMQLVEFFAQNPITIGMLPEFAEYKQMYKIQYFRNCKTRHSVIAVITCHVEHGYIHHISAGQQYLHRSRPRATSAASLLHIIIRSAISGSIIWLQSGLRTCQKSKLKVCTFSPHFFSSLFLQLYTTTQCLRLSQNGKKCVYNYCCYPAVATTPNINLWISGCSKSSSA